MRALTGMLPMLLVACAGLPSRDDGRLQREAMAGTERAPPVPAPVAAPGTGGPARHELSPGSGRYVQVQGRRPGPPAADAGGGITFNFENQPIQTVAKAILGDVLKRNYSIAPGVQGQVSFSTSRPVARDQVRDILDMLLAWTGNVLLEQGGRDVVAPLEGAAAGHVVPRLGASAPAYGLQARLFPLRYISALEMQKLIKPFARADAILLADPGRNLLVLAGTPQELRNYQQTVQTFDVDWLRGTSVGVFGLEQAGVKELLEPLNALFGPKGDTPLAGMFRFIPVERTNALVVITTQPEYLQEVGDWIARMDRGAGNEPQLHVYEVRNIQASELAAYLSDIYGEGRDGRRPSGEIAPGLRPAVLGRTERAAGRGAAAGAFALAPPERPQGGDETLASSREGAPGAAATLLENGVRIAPAEAGNQLLVRARPSQWREIQMAIHHLDVRPLQVQVEARILEVSLVNEFSLGVQWYLEGLAGATTGTEGGRTTIIPGDPGNHQQGAVGAGGGGLAAGDGFYYSFLTHNLQMAVHAMESSGRSKVLSAPSVVVMSNQVAHFQVGEEVPINTTSLNINSNAENVVNNATYLSTGVLLTVQPRINPGGLVYMDIHQQVSSALANSANAQGNPTISERSIDTQVAVQSGQTVLLGGMIQQQEGDTRQGMPWLGRIPWLGHLFGTTSRDRRRSEIIVLLTPRVIRDGGDAKAVSDEYRQQFESLRPLPPATRRP